jgi:hypothetical protein
MQLLPFPSMLPLPPLSDTKVLALPERTSELDLTFADLQRGHSNVIISPRRQ